jgi:hypothetical protein
MFVRQALYHLSHSARPKPELFVFLFLETKSCYVAQASMELVILLSQPSKVLGLQVCAIRPGYFLIQINKFCFGEAPHQLPNSLPEA